MKRLLAFLLFLSFELFSQAGTIRISFLQDPSAFQDTLKLLTNCGCSEIGVAKYQEAVNHYTREAFNFDFGKFPRPVNGFYSFSSTQELLAALPHHLGKTQHAFDLNCMDLVITVTDDRLKSGLTPDEISGPFLVFVPVTNGFTTGLYATARDAFICGYGTEYCDATGAFFSTLNQNSRICLTAGLYRAYPLPLAVTEATLKTEVMGVLRATWRSEKIQFPNRFEVVLVHSGDLSHHIISTDHAGVLFHSKDGYMYLEKAGGSGPFVRLDFKEKSDLSPWLAAAFLNPKPAYVQRFATFNAESIQDLDSR